MVFILLEIDLYLLYLQKICKTMIDIDMFESNMRRRMAHMPSRLRLFTSGYGNLPHCVMVTGARGCGKSTFLLYHAKDIHMLYLSMDNPLLASTPLYEVVRDVFMSGFEGVILDEVHYAADWSRHLKAAYDDFPDRKIWVSDSSALVLREGTGDLSRRFVQIKMPMMSFREYLYIETGAVYDKYRLGGLLPVEPDDKILALFKNYRRHGSRPFYQEQDYDKRFMGVLEKVLYTDIPFFLKSVTDNNLRVMSAIVGTLAKSSIPRFQVKSLCSDWGIGAEKLYQLLFVMEQVELIRVVRLQNDTKARSVGAKMLFADPCSYWVLDADKGTEREAFVAFCFSQIGWSVAAMKDERKGDFEISCCGRSFSVEVGGENKKSKGADYVLRDNTDYPSSRAIPFWLLAMMW